MHFHVRDASTGGIRAMDKYLEKLEDIRRIQTYVVARARREDVPVVENANVDRDDRPGDRARDARGRAGAAGLRERARRPVSVDPERRQCICELFARVTERSALAGARWLGRADKEAAEEAAFSGARIALERMPINGHVVIGGTEEGGAARRRHLDRRRRRGRTTWRSTRSRAAPSSRAAARTRSR